MPGVLSEGQKTEMMCKSRWMKVLGRAESYATRDFSEDMSAAAPAPPEKRIQGVRAVWGQGSLPGLHANNE